MVSLACRSGRPVTATDGGFGRTDGYDRLDGGRRSDGPMGVGRQGLVRTAMSGFR